MKLNRRLVGKGCTVLAIMVSLLGGLSAQGAYRMEAFTSEENFKHEVSLWAGPAIPLGNARSFVPDGAGTSVIPQGATFGGGVNVGYRFYPLLQLYIGATVFGQMYGYDYKKIDLGGASRIEHSGWSSYGAAIEIGTRLPLGIYGLYFTARIQAGYALMNSPAVAAIYSSQDVGDIREDILLRNTTGNLYLGGGIGVQYRVRRHLLCHIGLDYTFMPVGGWGLDEPVRYTDNTRDLSLRMSAFVINVGISYAF